MKRVLSLAVLIGGSLVLQAEKQPSASSLAPAFNEVHLLHGGAVDPNLTSIRVGTWNIDHGVEIDKVAEAMQTSAADLWLLQEVDWHTARAKQQDVAAGLAERLQFGGAFGIEFEELSQERGRPAYIGQATLTRLPMERSRVLRFQHQSGFWQPHSWLPSSVPLLQRRLGDRIALISELQLKGRRLVVYNAHLESRSAGPIQNHQLDEMLRDSERYPPGTAIILGGDLNTKYLPSIFLHKLEAAGFRSALGEHIERTHAIMMALDWIFVKGPLVVDNGSVRRDIKGSDHYPVYAHITSR